MELGLSLGDTTAKASEGFSTAETNTIAAAGVNHSIGFCMALGMNLSKETQIQEEEEEDDDDDDEDSDEDDGEKHEKDDNQMLTKEINISIANNQKKSSSNPPVQLDLLPSGPVTRHNSFPWSSDNGSSEGGSSGNVATGRGMEMRRSPLAMGTEEATSSFRLEFMNYGRLGHVNGASRNHKRGFEIGNNVVHEVERASSRASDEDDNETEACSCRTA